jgi:hypothetical protein
VNERVIFVWLNGEERREEEGETKSGNGGWERRGSLRKMDSGDAEPEQGRRRGRKEQINRTGIASGNVEGVCVWEGDGEGRETEGGGGGGGRHHEKKNSIHDRDQDQDQESQIKSGDSGDGIRLAAGKVYFM